MKNLISALFFGLLTSGSWAQGEVPSCLFYGYVEEGQFDEADSKKKKAKLSSKVANARIQIFVGDMLQSEQESRETGFYALMLPAGEKYRVVFEKEGYLSKCFEMDCRKLSVPAADMAYKCLVDVSLFRQVEDTNVTNLCKIPFARCTFDPAEGEMVWDMEYTVRTQEKFYQLAQPYYLAEKK
ncbi:MAG: hypothetical protein ACK5XV_08035 [Flavobacteriales bacterium]|jgi:hypothetical protein